MKRKKTLKRLKHLVMDQKFVALQLEPQNAKYIWRVLCHLRYAPPLGLPPGYGQSWKRKKEAVS
jgi:hypothetical protein